MRYFIDFDGYRKPMNRASRWRQVAEKAINQCSHTRYYKFWPNPSSKSACVAGEEAWNAYWQEEFRASWEAARKVRKRWEQDCR